MFKNIINFVKGILELYADISNSLNPDVYKCNSNVIYISNMKSENTN